MPFNTQGIFPVNIHSTEHSIFAGDTPGSYNNLPLGGCHAQSLQYTRSGCLAFHLIAVTRRKTTEGIRDHTEHTTKP